MKTTYVPLSTAAASAWRKYGGPSERAVYMAIYRAYDKGEIQGAQRREGAKIKLNRDSLDAWLALEYPEAA